MSQLKNVLLVALGAALIAETWYSARQSAALRAEATALRRQSDEWRGQYRQMQRQRDDAERLSASLASPAPQPVAATTGPAAGSIDSLETHVNEVLHRARLIKGWFDQHPEQKLGEFAYLHDADWLNEADRIKTPVTDDDYRKAAAQIRRHAEQEFMNGPLEDAMKAYLKTNGNLLPTSIGALAPDLDPAVDPSLLQHYAMIASGPNLSGIPLYAIDPSTIVVDPQYDTTMIAAGPSGMWSQGGANLARTFDAMQANNAYRIANNGQQPPNQELIVPYFKNPQFGAEFLANLHKRQ